LKRQEASRDSHKAIEAADGPHRRLEHLGLGLSFGGRQREAQKRVPVAKLTPP
jgi:hypothetical protein